MEGSFGADFGGVRVHTGQSADDLNRSLQSRAFTVGEDFANLSPADYIRFTIVGGWIYSTTALQARAMATLDQISGKSGQFGAKVDQTVTQFLTTLQQGVANGNSPNEQAANQALTSVLNNAGNALTQAQHHMKLGAIAAPKRLQELFRTELKGKTEFKRLFKRQVENYKKNYDTKSDVMYNYLALAIRYEYLGLRSAGKDHNTALAEVQTQYGKDVAKMSTAAETEKTVDPHTLATNERSVKIK